MNGAAASGTMKPGMTFMAMSSAAASVLPVSSYTRKESAKLPAMPPAAPSTVADMSSVKSRVQSFGFKNIASRLYFRPEAEKRKGGCFGKIKAKTAV